MTEAHVAAIANMPPAEDIRRDAEAKAKAMPKSSATHDAGPSHSASSTDAGEAAPLPKQAPKAPPKATPPWERMGNPRKRQRDSLASGW